MAEIEQENTLIKVSDLFGASRPAVRLIEAIERGVGNILKPLQMRRIAKAEIYNFNLWQMALEQSGLRTKSADLTLQDRAAVRLIAQEIQRQDNREAIALEAAREFKERIESKNIARDSVSSLELEWVDRFWRLAQDVTTAEMQAIWGKILARQTTSTGRFSPRCLETISLLTQDEIALLERLAQFMWSTSANKVPTDFILFHPRLNSGKQLPSELSKGIMNVIGNVHREVLGPAGIALNSGSGWAQSAEIDLIENVGSATIGNRRFTIRVPKADKSPVTIGSCLGISPVGGEIFSLINTPPDPTYIDLVVEAFKIQEITLAENKAA